MRNTEAQRYAQWSLAAAAALALLVAGVYARNAYLARLAEKKAPPAVPAAVEQRSSEFSFSKVEGQRTIYTVRASRATEFKEGSRNFLEDVDITVYGKKGDRDDTLRTRACDFISNTGVVTCAGEVQIRLQAAGAPHASANAIQVTTSAVTFDRDSGRAQTDKPVTFRWPAGDGRAAGVSYDSESGTLRLEHDVELNLSASPPAPAGGAAASSDRTVRLTGTSLSFQRETRRAQLEGVVRAREAARELSADALLLELDPALHARRIVASGSPQLRDDDPRGSIALSADEIASNLRPDGSVESIVATRNVHAARTAGSSQDTIDAGRVQIDLEGRQNLPRLLTASNGVALTSANAAEGAGSRRVETDALELHFSARSQPGETIMESVNTLAPARIEWRGVTTSNGKPIPQIVRMAGQQMNLRFGGQNQLQQLVSTGGVEVTRKLGDAPEQTTTSRELRAEFDPAGEWTSIDQMGDVRFRDGRRTGQSELARADHSTNLLTLTRSVVLVDGATRTTAQSASFVEGSSTLRAEGNVLTTELRAAASISNLAQEPAHISAEHLVVDTARGHAVYSGNSRLWQGQSVMEADSIELDSSLRTLVAKDDVRGVFPKAAWNPRAEQTSGQVAGQSSNSMVKVSSSQEARPTPQMLRIRGELWTYWETESRARVERSAQVDSEQGSIQADQIDLYFSEPVVANGSKQLSRALATGKVAVRQEDRRATSDRAQYTASEGKFVLSGGNPTLYSSTGDSTTGRQLTFYFADDRIVVDSTEGSRTVTLHQVEK